MKVAMYPFGREAETSLRDLFEYFKRCLQHGEWELANACVPQLVNSTGGLSENLRSIIKAIVCHPYNLKWESVGSPHKLAWFWLQVLEKWTKEQVPLDVRRELEFLLLLEELGSESIADTVLKQEVHQAFLDTQSEKKAPEGLRTTDAAVESCLRTLLEKKKPRLAQSLTQFLQDESCADDRALQHTFIQHLMKVLGKPERRLEKVGEWVEEIYAVLSVMPWSSGRSDGQLEALCEALWAARDQPLKEERILSSLLRPRCDALVSVYCAAALRLQRDHLLRSAPDTQVDLPEAEKLALSLCCHKDRPSIWKTIYFECLSSGKHFLEQVLVTALDLIKHEEFSQLKDLLRLEFQPLSRLLLLLGWTQCRSLSAAQTLLGILHREQAPANDSVLQEFSDLLSSQLDILEWCKNNNPGISMEALLAQLHTLDNHSALYILHSLTPLAQFEERKILDLLQQLPNATGNEDTEVVSNLSSSVQRNIVLFQGFCAMKYAIYALCVNAHKYSNCTECEPMQQQQQQQQQQLSEAEMDQTKSPTSSEGCHLLFQHYLSECQLYLEAVPAVFRLELLENIFSLLFLSTTDFSQQIQKDTSWNQNTGNVTQSELLPDTRSTNVESGTKAETDETEYSKKENQKRRSSSPSEAHRSHLELGHFIQGCRGFLSDVAAMTGFLKLLKEGLEGMCVLDQGDQEAGGALLREAGVAENLGCSVTAETFGPRLQRLSKRTAEAQWRLQIITSNQGSGSGSESPFQMSAVSAPVTSLGGSESSSLRRRKRPRRQTSVEKHNGEVSTSASDGGGGTGCVELEVCPCGGPHSWLVPAMLSPPESLLMSCIHRGNFMEAHQVSLVFDLEASACCGELVFMERYKEVLVELERVEQKIESQSRSSSSSSSEGLGTAAVSVAGRSRLGSSGLSTLQAIGSAAAAGVAFYSISDIADRLLSTPAHPMPSLEDGYWLSRCTSDPSGLLYTLLEELSPAAMAAFDLACCHCQLWKTSRQLLDTAERRLGSSLEARGVRVDPKVPHSEGICGFPMVLQHINKILNHSATNKSSVKTEAVGEDQVSASPFGCCIQEVLLCCYPALSEESIAARLGLAQRLETTVHILSTATTDGTEGSLGSALLAQLVEQASLKQSELDGHPVRSSMKQLLRSLDQLCPFEPDGDLARPDYVRSFLDYVNTLASVLVRSLGSEDQSSEVKLGNPLLVLLQAPFQLLSYLLFDRQVSPDRVLSLLQQDGLRLSVQQVIVQRCCETLPVWISCPADDGDSNQAKKDDGVFGVASLSVLLQQHAQEHVSTLGITEPQSEPSSESEDSGEDNSNTATNLSTSPPSHSSSSSSPSSSSSFLLTPSALSFLKSRSPLLATLACLSACKGEIARTQSSGWSGYFRSSRKEVCLDGEQISREADNLLKEFPILRAYLHTMAEPLLGALLSEGEQGSAGLGAVVCGKPVVSLLLSGPQDEVTQAVAAEAFQKALTSRDLSRALSLLELYGQGSSQEGALRDRLLACAALEDGDEGIGQLFRVQDANLRARVALQALERWPLSACLELLEFCLNDLNTDASLRTDLELKKKELDIYHRMLNLQPPFPWATWQELRTESKNNSESMLSMMVEAKEFALCAQWVELYPVSEQLRLQLQTEQLLHLLERGQTDEAFQLLEDLSDFVVGLDVCERALDRRPGLAACHFLADYLTLHFQRQVSPARRRHIHALHLGSKVLLTLPPAARQEYFPLLSEPLLMLEQLLMNLKVDWADVAVRTLRSLLVGQEAGFGGEDIDKLLANYACKALDFPCAPRERSRSDSVISLQDALMQCPAQDSCSLSFSRIESPATSAGSTPTHTCSSNSTDRENDRSSAGRKRPSSAKFQPPEQTPARKDWVPDTKQDVCMVCRRERFTMFNRRHHCRRCGRLVCHSCSEHKMSVEGCPEDEDVRVCDHCYAHFHPDSDDELEPAEVAGSPVVTEEALDGMLHLPEVVQRQIKLSTNPAENQLLQSEFYYEQAPSAYLCVAILSLHNDQTACGHQLISHCRSLSCKLTNPEVDACLLTDIMQQLLFSAKMMFVKVGRSQDLALCDSYISKVDVLKILVTANYMYIPSLDDILETSAVTRLRNQLLEAEHYQLAVEVSTKSGLDPGGVWQAWGMASLKAGNLSGAREKFARFLKAPVDRNQLNQGPLLLQEVVHHLENTVQPGLATPLGEDILASLRELEDALCEAGPVERPEGQTQRSNLHQECLYYLNTYGTHMALINFYMRHDCVPEALTYLLNKECPDEVFLEGVLQPCLERGRLGMLQGILEKLDPGLDTCSRYLIASCQFLQRRGYYNTLYQLQQFMMDQVRAAMTCIRFFTHGASSYLKLGEQQRWLVRAKEHLRTYLQEQQGRGAGRKRSQVNSFRKMMSSSDVSRHMNTIELQLEVTRFLQRCESAASSKAPKTSAPSPESPGSTSPPTLFGGSPMKVEVACKVMLGGKNIEEGFGIAYRVIQDFQLEAQAVYVRAGQRLVRQRQYGAVRQLLKCVGESGTATKNDCDALILSCVSIADKGPADAKELESLILETKSTESKIKAYLLCSKLRPAYLLAVKLEPSRAGPLVQEVLRAAEGAQDSVMQNICGQWLSEHHSKSSQQRQGRPNAR
ncbi:zinc finger FYVE domain-containing protein 26 isoform X1 [Cyclopterus lumpus]|uniref:zinc finger FYVE domain-containing protein 26 isoform X1 n=1 Tax=Cyclopterus lumpus TaxID=8103 RepID=UPI001486AC1C|nr:zinc finger FYVE domain-containing protein 26 isoform X1 [Cyclopterus lumpus]